MKIGISLLDFQPGKSGGIETYMRDLIIGLENLKKPDEYYLFVNEAHKNSITTRSINFHTVVADQRNLSHKMLHKLGKHGHSVHETILRKVTGFDLDVILFPLQHIPLGLEKYSGKFVVSIMDIQHEYFKDFFSQEDYRQRHSEYKTACQKAAKIIAISDFTKQNLVDKYSIESSKIQTVYLNVNTDNLGEHNQSDISKKFGSYFYYPAATWPHKNHLKLIEAFRLVTSKHPEAKLVCSGIPKSNEDKILKLIDKYNLKSSVYMLGFTENKDWANLIKNAYALVFPSLFEGFGIPVLEAMYLGVPTIISQTTSLPEVGGKATLYVDPNSADDIASKMIKLLEDKKLRKELIALGHKQASKFSLKKITNETYEVLKEVANEK